MRKKDGEPTDEGAVKPGTEVCAAGIPALGRLDDYKSKASLVHITNVKTVKEYRMRLCLRRKKKKKKNG